MINSLRYSLVSEISGSKNMYILKLLFPVASLPSKLHSYHQDISYPFLHVLANIWKILTNIFSVIPRFYRWEVI